MAERKVTFLIGANIKNFQKGLGTAQKNFQKFGRDMKAIGSTMNRNITLPVLAAGAAIIKAAGDFESSFADIRKTVDASESEFASIEKQMRSLAKTIPTSVNELNRMAGVAGQLGVGTGNIVQFTKTIAMLGDTTDIAGEQAALSLSRFMNIMGTSEEDIDRLGSAIVGLGNNFAAMESEIVEIATSMAPLGNSIGLTEQQVLAFATTIAASGGKIEAASTGFQKTANIMKQAVIEGNSNLEMFAETAGMTAFQFKRAFQQDAAGALQSFLIGLRKVQEEGGSTATVLEKLGLADQRIVREFGKVLGNLDDLDAALKQSNLEWERNTALTEEAQERYRTLNSRLGIAYNWIYDLGILFGNTLIPVVDKFIEIIKRVVGALSNMDDSTRRLVVGIALTAAAIGPVIWLMGTMVTSTAAVMGAISGLITVMTVLGKSVISFILVGSFTKFTAAMRLARMKGIVPLGKAILASAGAMALMAIKVAAVIAVIGGIVLIAKSIYDAWEDVGPFFGQIWDNITKTFAWGVQEIAKIMMKMPGMQGQGLAIIASMEQIRHEAQKRIEARGIVTFGDTVSSVWDEMKNNTSEGIDFIKGKFADVRDFVSGLIPDFSFGGEGDGPDGEGIRRYTETIEKAILPIETISERLERLSKLLAGQRVEIDKSVSKWEEFKDQFQEIGGEFKSFLAGEMSSAVLKFGDSLGRSLSGAENQWQTTFEKIVMVVLDFAESLARLAAGIGAVMVFIPGLQGAGVGLLAAATALQAISSGFRAGIDKRASNRENRANEGIPRMATGGIVPAGFPNDTYPAFLSSDETVIPSPKALPSGGRRSSTEYVPIQLNMDSKTIWEGLGRLSRSRR